MAAWRASDAAIRAHLVVALVAVRRPSGCDSPVPAARVDLGKHGRKGMRAWLSGLVFQRQFAKLSGIKAFEADRWSAPGVKVGAAALGVAIDNPNIDFSMLARSMGLYGEGPISDPKDLGPALHRAAERVEKGEIDPSFVITHKVPLSDGPEMYRTFRDKQDSCIKVVLEPA